MFLKHRILGLGLAVALLASPARAGDVDAYLPADTEVYTVLNVRQILGSGLVKKVGIDNIKAIMQTQQELTDVLKDLGMDPLKDIDRIVSAGPATGEQDKGLIIVRGRFDVEKFTARADKEAKDNKDVVKKIKIGDFPAYEVVIADAGLSLFVGIASKNTILAAMSKDYLGDALKLKEDAKPNLKNKNFQDMLTKLDDKQSMAMVVLGDVLTKGPLGDIPGNIKDMLAKVAVIHGGITLTDGIKIEFSAGTKEAAAARDIKDGISNAVNAGVAFAAIAAMQNKDLAPLVDFLKTVKVTSRDKSVSIKAEISGEDLGKLIPGGAKDQ